MPLIRPHQFPTPTKQTSKMIPSPPHPNQAFTRRGGDHGESFPCVYRGS